MKVEIKSHITGGVLFTAECASIKVCLQLAVKSGASLRGAYLGGASLRGAYLGEAYLRGAYLGGADLRGAYLRGAYLVGADLGGADLRGADLGGADLRGARDAELIIAQQRITPQEGAFVGWKKLPGDIIAKLVIPHDAGRVNSIGSRKCRASKVFVHGLYDAAGALLPSTTIGYDKHEGKTAYREGCEVLPDSFDDSNTVECSHGIHFFITREEALAY